MIGVSFIVFSRFRFLVRKVIVWILLFRGERRSRRFSGVGSFRFSVFLEFLRVSFFFGRSYF